MTEKVWVAIRGIRSMDGETEDVEESGRGTYYRRNGNHYILWPVGEKAARRIRIAGDSLTVSQENGRNAMSFESGRNTCALYGDPGAKLSLEIRTGKFLMREEENLLEAEVEYSLYHEGLLLSDNRMQVTVRPQGE